MFSDSLMAMMFMQVLCFVGTLVMFLFIIRSLAAQTAAMRDAQRKQQEALADIERQMMDMAFHLRRMSAGMRVEAGALEQMGDLGSLLDTVSSESSPRIQEDLAGQSRPESVSGEEASPESLNVFAQDGNMPPGTDFPGDMPTYPSHGNALPDLDLPPMGKAPAANSRNAARHGELSLRLDG